MTFPGTRQHFPKSTLLTIPPKILTTRCILRFINVQHIDLFIRMAHTLYPSWSPWSPDSPSATVVSQFTLPPFPRPTHRTVMPLNPILDDSIPAAGPTELPVIDTAMSKSPKSSLDPWFEEEIPITHMRTTSLSTTASLPSFPSTVKVRIRSEFQDTQDSTTREEWYPVEGGRSHLCLSGEIRLGWVYTFPIQLDRLSRHWTGSIGRPHFYLPFLLLW